YIHLSSAGVIPAVFDRCLPFVAYDYDTGVATPEHLDYLRATIGRRASEFFDRFQYKKIFVYIRPGSNTARALVDAGFFERSNVIYVFPGDPLTPYTLTPEEAAELEKLREVNTFKDDPDDVLPALALTDVFKSLEQFRDK